MSEIVATEKSGGKKNKRGIDEEKMETMREFSSCRAVPCSARSVAACSASPARTHRSVKLRALVLVPFRIRELENVEVFAGPDSTGELLVVDEKSHSFAARLCRISGKAISIDGSKTNGRILPG